MVGFKLLWRLVAECLVDAFRVVERFDVPDTLNAHSAIEFRGRQNARDGKRIRPRFAALGVAKRENGT